MNVDFAKSVQLVDSAHNGEPRSNMLLATKVDCFQHAIEHFAVIHLHDVRPARNPKRLHRIRRHHAHLGVRGG
jgi:hypothetical protein